MKGYICALVAFICLFASAGIAEETVRGALNEAGIDRLYEFAGENGTKEFVRDTMEGAMEGRLPDLDEIGAYLCSRFREPFESIRGDAVRLLGPMLLLALLRAVSSKDNTGISGACFLLKLRLILQFYTMTLSAVESSRICISASKEFTDAVSPVLTGLLTATGMSSAASLVSPAASLAGNAAEKLFLHYGIRLCSFGLCTAAAGNLSPVVDLCRITKLMRKTANWCAGLATTLFTALLALQGKIAGGLDSIAVRTAKFAVDSAAPVIGSGVSDAWESYVSGLMIAKNAVGVSGFAALIGVAAEPMIRCGLVMLLLNLVSAALDVFGEKETSRAADQISGICQMALSLSTGAVVIASVLLGAVMAAGQGLGF